MAALLDEDLHLLLDRGKLGLLHRELLSELAPFRFKGGALTLAELDALLDLELAPDHRAAELLIIRSQTKIDLVIGFGEQFLLLRPVAVEFLLPALEILELFLAALNRLGHLADCLLEDGLRLLDSIEQRVHVGLEEPCDTCDKCHSILRL